VLIAEDFDASTHSVAVAMQGQKHILQVFHRVVVYIRVVEQDAGGRKLVLNLVTPDGIFIGSCPPKNAELNLGTPHKEEERRYRKAINDDSMEVSPASRDEADEDIVKEDRVDFDESEDTINQSAQNSNKMRLKALRPPAGEKKRLIGRLVPPGSKRKLRQKLR